MPADDGRDTRLDPFITDEDIEVWGGHAADGSHQSLVELVNRVLDKGVCITGDVTISVAGVDLVYLGLNAILTSVATAKGKIDPSIGRTWEPRGLDDGR